MTTLSASYSTQPPARRRRGLWRRLSSVARVVLTAIALAVIALVVGWWLNVLVLMVAGALTLVPLVMAAIAAWPLVEMDAPPKAICCPHCGTTTLQAHAKFHHGVEYCAPCWRELRRREYGEMA